MYRDCSLQRVFDIKDSKLTVHLQLGSTEWVEENRELLASRAVAYLNVDCAVSEPRFYASATPQLDELLIQATQQVLLH